MMNNFAQALQIIQSGGNPQAMLMSMAKQQSTNNPIMSNVLEALNSNNAQSIQNIAINLCKEKGVTPNDVLLQIKNFNK